MPHGIYRFGQAEMAEKIQGHDSYLLTTQSALALPLHTYHRQCSFHLHKMHRPHCLHIVMLCQP